jgi:CubicO group peptidase (beta-lactamase class C family)
MYYAPCIVSPRGENQIWEATLADVKDVVLDEFGMRLVDQAAASSHEMRPAHVADAFSFVQAEARPLLHREDAAPAGAFHLDVNAFGEAVHATMSALTIGYYMQLRQKGTKIAERQWNWAHTPADGSLHWNAGRSMHIASCSKFITAFALCHVLAKHNISPNTTMAQYLPSYWSKGFNVNKITFANLMTHMSGLTGDGVQTDYGFMKFEVGIGAPGFGSYKYENMNFGLMRILIAIISGAVPKTATFPNNDQMWDFLTINAYRNYCQSALFAPSGVTDATFTHPVNAALAYSFPLASNGWNSGDLSTVSGGAGWHMSPQSLLDVMGTARRKGTIFTATVLQSYLDASYGIDVIKSTPLGTYYHKNGGWGSGSGLSLRSEQTVAYFLPGDMELVAFTNSPIGPANMSFRSVMTKCFTENIKPN